MPAGVVFQDYVGGIRFSFETKDLIMVECQAIVNSTGPSLDNSGLVSGSLKMSFPQLDGECKTYMQTNKPLEPEQVVAFKLRDPTAVIINVVSPTHSKYGDSEEAKLVLSNVIFNAIKEAHLQKCDSIAIPTVGIDTSGLSAEVCALGYWNAMRRCSSHHGTDLSNLKRVCFANRKSDIMDKLKEHLVNFSTKARNEPDVSATDETAFAMLAGVKFCENPGCGKAIKPSELVKLPDGMAFCKACLRSLLVEAKKATVPYSDHPKGKWLGLRYINDEDLPNFKKGTGIIELHFQIEAGFQGSGHPHPGAPYMPVDLKAYLPNDLKGKQLTKNIKDLFDSQKLFRFTWSYSSGRKSLLVPKVTLLTDKTDPSKSWTGNSMKNLEKELNGLMK